MAIVTDKSVTIVITFLTQRDALFYNDYGSIIVVVVVVQRKPVHFSLALKICVLKDPCFDICYNS
jgi:hypothetical protein